MKLIRPEDRRTIVRQSLRRRPSDRRRFSGIVDKLPKSIWRYIHLECGHLTTPEEAERNRLWRPSKGLYWCDSCDKWLPAEKKKPPPELPEEPMF